MDTCPYTYVKTYIVYNAQSVLLCKTQIWENKIVSINVRACSKYAPVHRDVNRGGNSLIKERV